MLQNNRSVPETYRLWNSDAPAAQGHAAKDIPELTAYIPAHTAPCAACVICPGGAFTQLCTENEGTAIALWLNTLGIAGFVLKYRLEPDYRMPTQIIDVQRSIRFLREHTAEWDIDPHRIAIAGFSAGGLLAAQSAVFADTPFYAPSDECDKQSCRPDATILFYPFLNCADPVHDDMRDLMPLERPFSEAQTFFSPATHVSVNTPPAFIAHAANDPLISVEHSRSYAAAMQNSGCDVMFLELERGEHGFGNATPSWESGVEAWRHTQNACKKWLFDHHFTYYSCICPMNP